MKIKLLIVLSLSAFLLLTGCRGDANTNTTTNANRAANTVNVNMSTPVAQTNESAATDTVMKNKVESALKAKGFNDVTVDATTTPASLRGTVPKGKMAEAIQTAQEAAGKPLNNQITEK
jgi:PBP1b-binding outer membrane lipoprotein LpoB